MGTIPTVSTLTPGTVVTASYLNSMKDAIDFWGLTPRCYAYRSSNLSIPGDFTWTLVTLNAEVYDIVQSGDSPSHDNSTNSSRIYIRTSGKYEISGACEFQSNSTGARSAKINLNSAGVESGGTMLVTQTQGAVGTAITTVPLPSVEADLSAGDYVEMFARQNSGSSLNAQLGRAQTFMRIKLTGS